jgi:Nucleoside 2-deoxyribosyltransferase
MKRKVYIAGPHLFSTDYAIFSRAIAQKCNKTQITPVFPGDDRARTPQDIYTGNLDLIRQCDGVIADLNPFRSEIEPDSGTSMECGFAAASGIPIVGIVEDQHSLLHKMRASSLGCNEFGGVYRSDEGDHIENFNLPLNLMLFHALETLASTMDEAIHYFDHKTW